MKKIFLLALVTLMVIISHPGNAKAWIFGEAPRLEYSSEELQEAAEAVCLDDLYKELKRKSYEGTNYRRLWWAVRRKKASFVVSDVSYRLGNFREVRHTGIMGWPFYVRGRSKAILATPQGNLEFEKKSSVMYFIWVRERDGKQIIDPPEDIAPFSNWGR